LIRWTANCAGAGELQRVRGVERCGTVGWQEDPADDQEGAGMW